METQKLELIEKHLDQTDALLRRIKELAPGERARHLEPALKELDKARDLILQAQVDRGPQGASREAGK